MPPSASSRWGIKMIRRRNQRAPSTNTIDNNWPTLLDFLHLWSNRRRRLRSIQTSICQNKFNLSLASPTAEILALQTPPTNRRSLIKLLLISSLVMEQSIKTTRSIPVFARWAAPSTQIFIDVSKSLYDERFRFEYFLSQTEAELEFREGGNWWFNCVPPVGEWQIWNWGMLGSPPPLLSPPFSSSPFRTLLSPFHRPLPSRPFSPLFS